MPDEVFEIGFETTGDAQAAAAFEKLKLEQRDMQGQARALNARLRELEQTGQTSTVEFQELSRAYIQAREAAGQLGRQANGIAADLRDQATASETAATGLLSTSRASKNAGRELGLTVNSIAELGFSLGTAIPGMQTYGTQLAMMGGNAVQFGASLGPAGVALGVLSGLLPVAISAFVDFSDATDEASESQSTLEVATKDANDALRAQIELLGRRDRLSRLGGDRGLVTGEDATAEQETLQRTIDRQRAQLDDVRTEMAAAQSAFQEAETARVQSASAERNRAANEALERVRRLSAQEYAIRSRLEESVAEQTRVVQLGLSADRQDRAAREEEDEERQADRRRGHRRRLSEAEREEERKRVEAVRAASQAIVDQIASEYRQREEMARAHTQMLLAEQRREEQDLAERMRRVDDDIQQELRLDDQEARRAMQAAEEDMQRMHQRQQELGQITTGMWSSIGGTVTQAAGDMFRFLISGAEGGSDAFLALLDSFLESTAVEYSIKALAEGANAVAAAARYDYAAAAQHGVAAGLAVAVAAATGIAGAAIQVPQPGQAAAGGGAGRGQIGAPSPGAGPGGGNVTVNLFAPNTVMTQAEQGQLIGNLQRAARREFGAQSVRV